MAAATTEPAPRDAPTTGRPRAVSCRADPGAVVSPEPVKAPAPGAAAGGVRARAAVPVTGRDSPTPSGRWGSLIAGRYAVSTSGARLEILDVVAMAKVLAARDLSRAATSEPLLAPVVVELPRARASALVDHADALSDVGVEISAFGPGSIAVMGVPRGLSFPDVAAMLKSVAEVLVAGDADLPEVVVAAADLSSTDLYEAQRVAAAWSEAGLGEMPLVGFDADAIARWFRARES